MTEMKHTKEPWKYNDKTGCIEGLTREPDKHWTGKCHVIGHLFHDADSARAAVCVSALSGIPNPPAFVEAVKELVDMLDRAIVYHSNGTVARVEYANGVVQALDNLRNHLPAEGDKR